MKRLHCVKNRNDVSLLVVMTTAVTAVIMVMVMVVVMFVMVIAVGITLLRKLSAEKREHLLFYGARSAGVDLNTRCPKAINGSAADTATNEGVYILADQETNQGTVTFSRSRNDAFFNNFTFFGRDDVKLWGAPKMGKDLGVLGCYCNFH